DQARAHAMQSQQIQLLWRLDRHKAHGGSLHCFRDRLGIAIVVLVPLEERLYVLRWDQTHIVADRCQLPTNVMSARACLRADQATPNVGEASFKLTAGHLLLQTDYTPLVASDVVDIVVADVDTDHTCI